MVLRSIIIYQYFQQLITKCLCLLKKIHRQVCYRAVCSSLQPLRAVLKHQLLNRRCQVLYFNSNAALQALVQGQASQANSSLHPISQCPYITEVLMLTCLHKKQLLSSVLVTDSGTSLFSDQALIDLKHTLPLFLLYLSHCLCQVVVFLKQGEKVRKWVFFQS